MNHPKLGSNITVEPIRKLEHIELIKKVISNDKRNLLLFTLGINNGLRAGDILQLKVKDVRHLKSGEIFSLIEQKTKKKNILMINKSVYKALHSYLDDRKPDDNDYLFKSKKGDNQPLSVSSVNGMIKGWCKSIGLKGNYGTHSMRKTWGYIQRTKFGVGFEVISKRFNHSSPTITMRYICVENREVSNILMNEI